jgi:hypothetical protein
MPDMGGEIHLGGWCGRVPQGGVGFEPSASFGPEGRLLRCVPDVHVDVSTPAPAAPVRTADF